MDTLYMSGLMQLFLVFVYVPLVLLGLRWVWRRMLPSGWGWKVGGTISYLALATLLVLGDVLYTHWQMARLCPDAGLHVYRSVEVEGFYSEIGLDARAELERGFQYVEFKKGSEELGWVQQAVEGSVDGRCSRSAPNCAPRSRYWLIEALYQPVSRTVYFNEFCIIDRNTQQVLGLSRTYVALPGWLDRFLLQMLDPTVWPCGERSAADLTKAVLLPRSKESRRTTNELDSALF